MAHSLSYPRFHISIPIVLLSFLGASCGSYQSASYYDNDGIYAERTERAPVRQQHPQQVASQQNSTYGTYFGQKADEYDQILDSEIFTDVDEYSGNPEQVNLQAEQQLNYYNGNNNYNGYGAWGDNPSQVTVNIYDNWGSNYGWGGPFDIGYYGYYNPWRWNRYGYYGYPGYGWSWGWGGHYAYGWGGYYSPYYYSPYYSRPYYGHHYYNRNYAYSASRRGLYNNDRISSTSLRGRTNQNSGTSQYRNSNTRSNINSNTNSNSRYRSSTNTSRTRVGTDGTLDRNNTYRTSRSTRTAPEYNSGTRTNQTYRSTAPNNSRYRSATPPSSSTNRGTTTRPSNNTIQNSGNIRSSSSGSSNYRSSSNSSSTRSSSSSSGSTRSSSSRSSGRGN